MQMIILNSFLNYMKNNDLTAIIIFIISIFVILLTINLFTLIEMIKKKLFVFNVVLFLLALFFMITYNELIKDEKVLIVYYVIAIIIILMFLILFYINNKISASKIKTYNLISKSLKDNNLLVYIIIDSKDNIKNISTSFLRNLGMQEEDVLNKNVFEVFNKTIRITKFNNIEFNNIKYQEYYKGLKKNKKKVEYEIELEFQNANGNHTIFKLYEKPIFYFNKYKGRINIGEVRSDINLLQIEKDYSHLKNDYNSIKEKFIATLEITKESLFFCDIDKDYYWINDSLKNKLSLPTNTIITKEFYNLIHKDDLVNYLNGIKNLNMNETRYQIKYRFLIDNDYVWVNEVGKRIFDPSQNTILGYIDVLNTEYYEKTGIALLDNLKSELAMFKELGHYLHTNRVFDFIIIKLSGIPSMNEKYTRKVGNMMISDYLQQIEEKFKSENFKLYRVSGLEFVVILTDLRKMELFRKTLEKDHNALNLNVEYGGITESIKVHIGVSRGLEDAMDVKNLYEYAKKALKVAESEEYNKNVCFYDRIK